MGAELETFTLCVKWHGQPVKEIACMPESVETLWAQFSRDLLAGKHHGWVSLRKNGHPIRYTRSPGYGPITDSRRDERSAA